MINLWRNILNKEELLKSSAASIGVELNDTQVQQFIKYHEILVEWNSFMNLTGITEYEEVVQKHFVDSLALCKAIDVSKAQSLMDFPEILHLFQYQSSL